MLNLYEPDGLTSQQYSCEHKNTERIAPISTFPPNFTFTLGFYIYSEWGRIYVCDEGRAADIELFESPPPPAVCLPFISLFLWVEIPLSLM